MEAHDAWDRTSHQQRAHLRTAAAGAAAGSEGDRSAAGCRKSVTVARVVVYITRIVSSPFERAAHGLLKGTHSLDRELLDKAEGQITIVHPCPA